MTGEEVKAEAVKLTEAQTRALRMIQRRDWPAGEPRLSWLHKATGRKLLALGLIRERPGSRVSSGNLFERTAIIDLTEAGRAAIASTPKTGGQDG